MSLRAVSSRTSWVPRPTTIISAAISAAVPSTIWVRNDRRPRQTWPHRNVNPTPRTVWMWSGEPTSSSFARIRRM